MFLNSTVNKASKKIKSKTISRNPSKSNERDKMKKVSTIKRPKGKILKIHRPSKLVKLNNPQIESPFGITHPLAASPAVTSEVDRSEQSQNKYNYTITIARELKHMTPSKQEQGWESSIDHNMVVNEEEAKQIMKAIDKNMNGTDSDYNSSMDSSSSESLNQNTSKDVNKMKIPKHEYSEKIVSMKDITNPEIDKSAEIKLTDIENNTRKRSTIKKKYSNNDITNTFVSNKTITDSQFTSKKTINSIIGKRFKSIPKNNSKDRQLNSKK